MLAVVVVATLVVVIDVSFYLTSDVVAAALSLLTSSSLTSSSLTSSSSPSPGAFLSFLINSFHSPEKNGFRGLVPVFARICFVRPFVCYRHHTSVNTFKAERLSSTSSLARSHPLSLWIFSLSKSLFLLHSHSKWCAVD